MYSAVKKVSASLKFPVFAYGSHLNDSDHQPNLYTIQITRGITKCSLNDDLLREKKSIQTCMALCEKEILPHLLNHKPHFFGKLSLI